MDIEEHEFMPLEDRFDVDYAEFAASIHPADIDPYVSSWMQVTGPTLTLAHSRLNLHTYPRGTRENNWLAISAHPVNIFVDGNNYDLVEVQRRFSISWSVPVITIPDVSIDYLVRTPGVKAGTLEVLKTLFACGVSWVRVVMLGMKAPLEDFRGHLDKLCASVPFNSTAVVNQFDISTTIDDGEFMVAHYLRGVNDEMFNCHQSWFFGPVVPAPEYDDAYIGGGVSVDVKHYGTDILGFKIYSRLWHFIKGFSSFEYRTPTTVKALRKLYVHLQHLYDHLKQVDTERSFGGTRLEVRVSGHTLSAAWEVHQTRWDTNAVLVACGFHPMQLERTHFGISGFLEQIYARLELAISWEFHSHRDHVILPEYVKIIACDLMSAFGISRSRGISRTNDPNAWWVQPQPLFTLEDRIHFHLPPIDTTAIPWSPAAVDHNPIGAVILDEIHPEADWNGFNGDHDDYLRQLHADPLIAIRVLGGNRMARGSWERIHEAFVEEFPNAVALSSEQIKSRLRILIRRDA